MKEILASLETFLSKSFLLSPQGYWLPNTKNNNHTLSYPENAADEFNAQEDQSWWFQHRNECIHSLVNKYHQKGILIDLGGGNGIVSRYLRDRQIASVVVEPGVAGVRNTAKKNLQPVINCSVEDLIEFKISSPSIGAFDVVEHIENDHHFLQMIAKVLDSKGYLFITVPAYHWLWSDDDVYAGHFRRYSKSSISSILEKNGFLIEYATYFFSVLIPIIFVFRTIPSFFSRSKKLSLSSPQQDHQKRSGFVGIILSFIFSLEKFAITNKKTIPFGSSILIVAKKKT